MSCALTIWTRARDRSAETFPDAVLTMTAPGRFEAVYTYVDKTSGTEVQREGKCQWDCDGLTGADPRPRIH